MAVLAALLRSSIENPEVPISSPALADWLSGERTTAGVRVTERRVLGLTAYLRALTLVSGTCASLPLKAYREGTRERLTQRTVLDHPNPAQTPFEFWQTMYALALGHGTAYARKARDGSGTVREVWPLHPSRVRVEPVDVDAAHPDGRLFIITTRGGTELRATSYDVLLLPYLSLDGISGLSVLQAARQSLGVAIAAEDTAAGLFGKGSRLGGVLQSKKNLTADQAGRLKRQWRAKVAGPENAGDIAVLDNETEFKAVALPPADAQLLESRKFSTSEIARMFGVPPHMLGDVEKSTSWGSGIEQQTMGFVVYTLRPWLTMVEQRVTRELLPNSPTPVSFAEYSLEGLLRGDSKTRAEFYRAMVQIGAMKLTDVQRLENWEPDDAVDFYTIPSNFTAIKADGTVVPLAAKAQGKTGAADTARAVDKVITADELRSLANQAGAELDVPGPLGGS